VKLLPLLLLSQACGELRLRLLLKKRVVIEFGFVIPARYDGQLLLGLRRQIQAALVRGSLRLKISRVLLLVLDFQ